MTTNIMGNIAVFIDKVKDGLHQVEVRYFDSEYAAGLCAQMFSANDRPAMIVSDPDAIEYLVKELCND